MVQLLLDFRSGQHHKGKHPVVNDFLERAARHPEQSHPPDSGHSERVGPSLSALPLLWTVLLIAALLFAMVATAVPAWATKRSKQMAAEPAPPDLLMDGGRRLAFERSFSLEREVKPKRSFWTKVVDVIAGQPDFHYLVSPYSVVTDSRGRIIVTDLGRRRRPHLRFQASRNISSSPAAMPDKDPMLNAAVRGRRSRRTISTSPIPRPARFSSSMPTANTAAPSAA